MPVANIRLGQLLVDARMISQQALDEVLQHQSKDGRRLGTLLVERGLINETQLTQILSHQLSVPWVALLHIEFSRQLLNLVPLEIAEKYCLVPIYVRHVRGQGDTLYVAMDDPTNEEPLRECMKYSGLPVRPMIAPPSDIREAIRVCYGVDIESPHSKAAMAKAARVKVPEPSPSTMRLATEMPAGANHQTAQRGSGERLQRVTEPAPPSADAASESAREITQESPAAAGPVTPRTAVDQPPAAPARDAEQSVSVVVAPPPDVPVPNTTPAPAPYDDTPVVEAIEIEIPRSRRARALEHASSGEGAPTSRRGAPRSQRMVSLTLLDGTTLTLPARPGLGAGAQGNGEDTETGDAGALSEGEAAAQAVLRILGALRAAAQKNSAAGSRGDPAQVEAVLAAILAALLKKHLVTEKEILDELREL